MSHFGQPEGYRRPKITMATHKGISKAGSERDSGFSDASSGYLSAVDLTDSEETGRAVSTLGRDHSTVVGCSYPGLSPMIIMNNFVLKQPNSIAPPEKPWSFPSSVEVIPQSQVVLLQPLVSNCSVGTTKTPSESNAQPKNYLPILKSYPRIAPHPGERPSKRQGSSALRSGSIPGHKHRRRQHHGCRSYSSTSTATKRQAPVKALPRVDSPALDADRPPSQPNETLATMLGDDNSLATSSNPHNLAPMLLAGVNPDASLQDAPAGDGNKLKRFSNTYNILNKSGLLGITLRTKQLMKDNRRTQSQLQQLQEHTDLLLEAFRTGDPQIWTRLQLAMQDKGSSQCEGQQLGGSLQGIPV